jgi:hypothetical protein
MAEASAAEAAAATSIGTTATEAENPNNNTQFDTAQQTRAVPPSHTAASAVDTGADAVEHGQKAPPFRNTSSGDPT